MFKITRGFLIGILLISLPSFLYAADVKLRAIAFESCISDGLKRQADAFKKAFPNIDVEIEVTAYTNLHEKVLIEMAGGSGRYDIVSSVSEWMPGYITSRFLEPLNSFEAASPVEGGLDSWAPGVIEFEKVNGQLYGIPHHAGPQWLYYRKDLFEDPANKTAFKKEYGYELVPPTTWKQFLDSAKFFTNEQEGMWGTVLTAKYGEQQLAHDLFLLLPGFGGGRGVDDKLNATFNSTEAAEALQFYADLINVHKVAPPASTTFGIPEAADLFVSGKVALHWNWSHVFSLSKGTPTEGKLGYTVIPKTDKGVHGVYVSYWNLGIPSSSKNKKEAWEFIKFATNVKNDKLMHEAGCVPVRKTSWDDPEIRAANPIYEQMESAYSGYTTSAIKVPEYEQVNNILQRYISKTIAQEMNAQEALNKAAEEYTELMKDIGRIE